MRQCSREDCQRTDIEARGLCSLHYQRAKAGKIPLPPVERCFTMEERFHRHHVPEPFSGCWLWTGQFNPEGYGQLAVWKNGKVTTSLKAHRLSYAMHKGVIPEGLVVMHMCDTPQCVNPAHLQLGTHKDNKHDAMAKRRHAHGETNAKSKLTNADILEIRRQWDTGECRNQSEIGRKYGVNSSVVCLVVHRKVWRHLA